MPVHNLAYKGSFSIRGMASQFSTISRAPFSKLDLENPKRVGAPKPHLNRGLLTTYALSWLKPDARSLEGEPTQFFPVLSDGSKCTHAPPFRSAGVAISGIRRLGWQAVILFSPFQSSRWLTMISRLHSKV